MTIHLQNSYQPVWQPKYPKRDVKQVSLDNYSFQTYTTDKKAGIIVQDLELEDPACFWIDYEHVYLRVNWSTWGTVSTSNKKQILSLCNSHFCMIMDSRNNSIQESILPVYRISALPKILFPETLDKTIEDCLLPMTKDKTEVAPDIMEDKDYKRCYDTISKTIKEISEDLDIYQSVKLGEHCASAVISSDSHALLLRFLPDITNYKTNISPDNKKMYLEDEWRTEKISLDFVEHLRSMKKYLATEEPKASIDIGFLANTETIDTFREFVDEKDIADLKLLTYVTLKDDLYDIFKLDTI
jgi:hypothetical protein